MRNAAFIQNMKLHFLIRSLVRFGLDRFIPELDKKLFYIRVLLNPEIAEI